ncbi:hypothetical protein ACQQ2N_05200 [Dokdonella sp. MW10]|uniref:hypothetical protein n=1 Tax=Dokdonella sp. MW10 TaxID=2992926 RepID=UPI003F81B443
MIDLVRRNAADALELFALPLLVALLPWRAGFALLRWRARHGRLHERDVEAAARMAVEHVGIADVRGWKACFRLVRLVERADTWLTLLRGRRWWSRHVDVEGAWPERDRPRILLTFHWGSGHWIWHLLAAHGVRAHFLARRPVPRDFGAGRVASWYGEVRARAMRRIGSEGVLYTGGSSAAIREALARGESVMGMLDVPAEPGQRRMPGSLLGHRVDMPFGLARLAESERVDVVILSCGLDPASGRRQLRLETLQAGTDAAAIMQRYLAHLDRRLREQSAFWHLWPAAPTLFTSGEDTPVR